MLGEGQVCVGVCVCVCLAEVIREFKANYTADCLHAFDSNVFFFLGIYSKEISSSALFSVNRSG